MRISTCLKYKIIIKLRTLIIIIIITSLFIPNYFKSFHSFIADPNERDESVSIRLKYVKKLKFVQQIDDWEHGIKFAQWRNKNVPKQKFPSEWVKPLEELLNPGG